MLQGQAQNQILRRVFPCHFEVEAEILSFNNINNNVAVGVIAKLVSGYHNIVSQIEHGIFEKVETERSNLERIVMKIQKIPTVTYTNLKIKIVVMSKSYRERRFVFVCSFLVSGFTISHLSYSVREHTHESKTLTQSSKD